MEHGDSLYMKTNGDAATPPLRVGLTHRNLPWALCVMVLKLNSAALLQRHCGSKLKNVTLWNHSQGVGGSKI